MTRHTRRPRAGWPHALGALLALTLITAPAWSATATRTSKFEYDSLGRLIKEIVEPSSSDLCLVTTHGYDGFGNRNTSTQRNCQGLSNEAAAPTGSAVFVARTKSAGYDAQGRFPLTSTNALNRTESRTYDPAYGGVTAHTDPNSVTSQWQYDSLGRKTDHG
jgi:hypothetical protein